LSKISQIKKVFFKINRIKILEKIWYDLELKKNFKKYQQLIKKPNFKVDPLPKTLTQTPLFIHVGFGHCATTSLQESLFPNLNNFQYVGKPFSPALDWAYNEVSCKPDHIYDAQDVKALFLNALSYEKPNIISAEGFTTSTQALFENVYVSHRQVANRLYDIFKGTKIKIIFTIRNQTELLRAYYYQLNQRYRNYNMVLPTIERWVLEQIKICNKVPIPMYDYLYYSTVKEYEQFFQKEDILILPLELLKHKKNLYFKRLSEFLGEPIDSGVIGQFKQYNPSKGKILGSQYQQLIKDFYRSDNQKFFEHCDSKDFVELKSFYL